QHPQTVYAGVIVGNLTAGTSATFRVYKSSDGGITWPISRDLTSMPVPLSQSQLGIAVDPGNSMIVYAAVPNGGFFPATPGNVFKSVDGGLTWNPTSLQRGAVAVTLAPGAPATVYAGGAGAVFRNGSVFKSTDGGVSWSTTPLAEVTALAIDPT